MFILLSRTWLLQRSHLRRGLGCSYRIMILSPQFWLIKCKRKPFHVREDPGKLGKGQVHWLVYRGNLILYTWGWCSVWMTASRLQLVAVSVPCMHRRCAVIDPTVISTTHYGQGILHWSLTHYEFPTPVHFRALAYAEILDYSAPGWHIIVRDLATLAARPYR